MTKLVSFKTTPKEFDTIVMICERVEKLARYDGLEPPDRKDLLMDLCATHANGCPLKLTELLAFPNFDFVHDVYGIMRHIDRNTGQLTRCFVPRCAR